MTANPPTDAKKGWRSLLEWVWVVAVLAFGFWYLANRGDTIRSLFDTLELVQIGAAFILLVSGIIIHVVVVRELLRFLGHDLTYLHIAYIRSVSQMAKYIPGGVWQYAGQYGYYVSAGMPSGQSARAVLWEILLLVLGMTSVLPVLFPEVLPNIWPVAVVGFVTAWFSIALYLLRERMDNPVSKSRTLQFILMLVLLPVLWGASIGVMLPVFELSTVGAFAVSWIIGFIVFFAPGGIGIRETVFAALLMTMLNVENGAIYMLLHRTLWFLADLAIGVLAIMGKKTVRLSGLHGRG